MFGRERLVLFDPVALVIWNDDFIIDGLDRADGNAPTAVNADLGINVEHRLADVKTFDGTYAYTFCKPAVRAVICNNVSQFCLLRAVPLVDMV